MLGGTAAVGLGRLVDALGSSGESPCDPADLLVRGEGQPVTVPMLEQLGQGVLQKREGPGLMGDVGDHLGYEPGLGPNADPLGRPSDRPLKLLGGERRDRLGPSESSSPKRG